MDISIFFVQYIVLYIKLLFIIVLYSGAASDPYHQFCIIETATNYEQRIQAITAFDNVLSDTISGGVVNIRYMKERKINLIHSYTIHGKCFYRKKMKL